MRAALVSTVLILASACSLERGTAPAPQPQKSALSMCHDPYHGERERRYPCPKPLFIVDGKVLADDGIDLNPSEIEAVEVFKGELALKRYGEAARDGVVLITTKRAVRGSERK